MGHKFGSFMLMGQIARANSVVDWTAVANVVRALCQQEGNPEPLAALGVRLEKVFLDRNTHLAEFCRRKLAGTGSVPIQPPFSHSLASFSHSVAPFSHSLSHPVPNLPTHGI